MPLGLSLGIGSSLSAGGWSPLALFSAGEQGAWYDPSDFSTMFQDSAGVTPVTAVELPVGLILDKRLGLVPTVVQAPLDAMNFTPAGSTPPTAANTSYLSEACGSIVFPVNAGGYAVSRGYSTVNHTIVAGRRYLHDYRVALSRPLVGGETLVFYTTGTVGGSLYTLTSATPSGVWVDYPGATGVTVNTSGGNYCVGYAGTAIASPVTLYIRQYQVREWAGNHALQATTAQKPTLSARVNLLTYSEQFDHAVWSKSRSTVTANATTAPDGTLTADKIVETVDTGTHRVFVLVAKAASSIQYTMTVFLKAGERTKAQLRLGDSTESDTARCVFDLAAGTSGTPVAFGFTGLASSIASIGDGWHRCSLTATTDLDTNVSFFVFVVTEEATVSYTGDGTSGLYLWGAQLETAPAATTYQRIAAATDYDTAGFLHYLKFDGVDDGLATAAIDFTATDKTTVIAGVRKLSDAAQGCIAELTASVAANNGSWLLAAPDAATATFAFDSKGTVQVDAVVSGNTAPKSAVLTGQADISSDTCSMRVNGVLGDTDIGDQGTGNYSNAALYIGRRGGASLPFNGHIYSLIVRGAATADVTPAEAYVAAKTGVTL